MDSQKNLGNCISSFWIDIHSCSTHSQIVTLSCSNPLCINAKVLAKHDRLMPPWLLLPGFPASAHFTHPTPHGTPSGASTYWLHSHLQNFAFALPFPRALLFCSPELHGILPHLLHTLLTMKLVKLPYGVGNQTIQTPVHLRYALSHTLRQFFLQQLSAGKLHIYLLICSFSGQPFLYPIAQQDVSFMSTGILVTGISYTSN